MSPEMMAGFANDNDYDSNRGSSKLERYVTKQKQNRDGANSQLSAGVVVVMDSDRNQVDIRRVSQVGSHQK